jgi:tRNA threonylcarbamoyladenosine biosynthesis protein TsaE
MEMIFDLGNIQSVAKEAWKRIGEKKVVAFQGEMGSGKTTLIRAMCLEKNVQDVVSSPTFSIINEYQSETGTIFHLDLYRLKDLQEAIQAGVEDCLYSGNTCLVEWPERAASLFPVDTVYLRLDVMSPENRRILIEDY